MYYEINVAKDGLHYFATTERSISTTHKAVMVLNHFQTLFPESEGYELTVTKWQETGTTVDFTTS